MCGVCVSLYIHTYHTHTMAYYSVIIKNEIIPFSTIGMDREIIILSEVSQKEKDIHHMILIQEI